MYWELSQVTHEHLAILHALGPVIPRAEHCTVYGIRPYPYGDIMVTGTPITVTVQWSEILKTVQYGYKYGCIRGDTGLYGCNFNES